MQSLNIHIADAIIMKKNNKEQQQNHSIYQN
jgi:hypothetical protein